MEILIFIAIVLIASKLIGDIPNNKSVNNKKRKNKNTNEFDKFMFDPLAAEDAYYNYGIDMMIQDVKDDAIYDAIYDKNVNEEFNNLQNILATEPVYNEVLIFENTNVFFERYDHADASRYKIVELVKIFNEEHFYHNNSRSVTRLGTMYSFDSILFYSAFRVFSADEEVDLMLGWITFYDMNYPTLSAIITNDFMGISTKRIRADLFDRIEKYVKSIGEEKLVINLLEECEYNDLADIEEFLFYRGYKNQKNEEEESIYEVSL